ncbi:MAG: FAD:protein FMN transferase [Planctomycetota bacterium]|jgi:thiamine biosynthesis lipoprotein
MNRWPFVLTTLLMAGLLVLGWFRAPGPAPTRFNTHTEIIMASPISVTAPAAVARDAADIVFEIFRDVDAQMSEWKPTSPLAAVNSAAGREPVEVPPELLALVRRGLEISARTAGAFDVTWGALWGLWDFKAAEPRVPDAEAIRQRAALVDFRRVIVDETAGTIYLPEANMVIGLGGIAKGYALDRAAETLLERGVEDFLISAAGQVMLSGLKDGRPWRVGVRDPRGGPDEFFASIELTETSLSTSGDYERFFMIDGVRYHHILDPRTGWPARGLRSATVISSDATLADALSTALMVLGTERGLALVESLPDTEALLVDAESDVHLTSGLIGHVQMRHPPTPGGP